MKLNHRNLPVENVKESRIFFKNYFDFKCIEEKGDNALVVLKSGDDFILVLMSQSFNRDEYSSFPSAFHVGFLVDTKEEVIKQYNKLEDGNVDVKNELGNVRGVFGFYFMSPGNILIEVSTVSK